MTYHLIWSTPLVISRFFYYTKNKPKKYNVTYKQNFAPWSNDKKLLLYNVIKSGVFLLGKFQKQAVIKCYNCPYFVIYPYRTTFDFNILASYVFNDKY